MKKRAHVSVAHAVLISVGVAKLSIASLGCEGAASATLQGGKEPDVTEHQPASGGQQVKQLGEDCTVHGKAECLSGLCVHVRPEREGGYVCSRHCAAGSDCPSGWRCLQVYGGPQGSMCFP